MQFFKGTKTIVSNHNALLCCYATDQSPEKLCYIVFHFIVFIDKDEV